jgi:hypothetical protein
LAHFGPFICKANTLAKADPLTSAEAARLDALISQLEGRLQAAFARFVQQATDDATMAEVSAQLERGDVNGALKTIQPYIDQLGTEMPRIWQDAAISETAAIAGQLPARASVGISFDVGNPEAAALMRANQLEFVQAFTEAQADATRTALAEGLDQGAGFIAASRAFKNSIGLDSGSLRAVANYRRLLRAGSSQALQRVLRDRRFDRTVERAISSGTPLTDEQIDRMVLRYQERALASRAETIARTESIKTLSEAQEAAFAQTQALAGIENGDVEETWHTTIDGRERLTHGIMNGQTVPRGTPFQSPSGAQLRYPGDPAAPAEEVINCRCHRSFRIILGGVQRLAA